MNNCFALRFNLQKCGYSFGENLDAFSAMFGESREFIEETLAQYEEINSKSAADIISKTDMSKFEYLKGKRIKLFGDSNTSDRLSWGKIIAKVLPCDVLDSAVSGWRSVQVLSEIDTRVHNQDIDIAVIQIGTNDSFFCDKDKINLCVSKEEYRRNLDIIISKLKSKNIKVIINSLPCVYCEQMEADNAFWSATYENNAEFNEIAKDVALKNKVCFFDFRDVFAREKFDELFLRDGVHLNHITHALIAEKFIRFLGDKYENYYKNS